MVGAGTVEHVGLGFRAYHRAFERDDAFQVLAITGTPLQVTVGLPDIYRGRGLPDSVARTTMTDQLSLRAPSGRFRYGLDGDVHTAEGELTLRVGPTVRVLMSSN